MGLLKWRTKTCSATNAARPLRHSLVETVKPSFDWLRRIQFVAVFLAELKVSTVIYELHWSHDNGSIKVCSGLMGLFPNPQDKRVDSCGDSLVFNLSNL